MSELKLYVMYSFPRCLLPILFRFSFLCSYCPFNDFFFLCIGCVCRLFVVSFRYVSCMWLLCYIFTIFMQLEYRHMHFINSNNKKSNLAFVIVFSFVASIKNHIWKSNSKSVNICEFMQIFSLMNEHKLVLKYERLRIKNGKIRL